MTTELSASSTQATELFFLRQSLFEACEWIMGSSTGLILGMPAIANEVRKLTMLLVVAIQTKKLPVTAVARVVVVIMINVMYRQFA